MSNFRNFNRYKCFNEYRHKSHSRLIEDVSDWAMWEEGVKFKNPVVNKLYGIWDGFLYDGLVEEARELGVPEFLCARLTDIVNHIEKYMAEGGEINENEAHAINLG